MARVAFNPKYNKSEENKIERKQSSAVIHFTPETEKVNYINGYKKAMSDKYSRNKNVISIENKKKIEDSVDKLLREIKYESKTEYIDIIEIAHKLGFVIGNAVMDAQDDGFIIVEEGAYSIMGIKTDRLIGVNANRMREWKRFIIAHEIAHYMLQYKQGTTNEMYAHRVHKTGKNEKENEADYYAAALLMPKERFITKYIECRERESRYDRMVEQLASIFAVTKRMIERRIKELKLNECE